MARRAALVLLLGLGLSASAGLAPAAGLALGAPSGLPGPPARPVLVRARVAAAASAVTARQAQCGTERWPVKTMTDSLAGQVNLKPQDSTIGKLVALAAPLRPVTRVGPTEDTTFRVHGVITLVKQEADRDYHVVIEDSAGKSMIVEATSPRCDQGSRVARQIAQVRTAMDQRFPLGHFKGRLNATVTGVGFFDRLHGQAGVAPNGIELHPLTALQFGP